MIGRTLGRYRIVEPLGRGGMGEVYKAFDEELGREVAMKLLPQKIAANETRLRRFRREARTLGALEHPNIVSLYSVEQVDDLHFLIMELVEGETVEALTPEFGMELEALFDIAIPMADALAEAHDRGIVHRDLKPSNVIVDGDGLVRVLDFGLAKLQPDRADEALGALSNDSLTAEGVVVGTMPYMSPEQIEGEPVDQRSDIFSLGTVLYEMACARRPFTGTSAVALMSSILRDYPPTLTTRRPELPLRFDLLVRRCHEKRPDRRYQTAHDVKLELETVREELKRGS